MKYYHIILTIAFTFGLSISAYPCRCEGEMTVKNGVSLATMVFKGKILSKRISDSLEQYGAKLVGNPKSPMRNILNYSMAVYKVEVERVYKGKLSSKIITIITAQNTAGCGYQFELGKEYIIYASDSDYRGSPTLTYNAADDRTYWTHTCTRTQQFDSFEEREIIKALK